MRWPDLRDVADARGKVQRGKSRLGMGSEIGASLNQELEHLRMLLGRGPHQRGLILVRFFGVRICAVNQQHADSVGAAGPRACHQRRFAGSDRRVWICSGLQK